MLVDFPTIESFSVTVLIAVIRTVVEAAPTILGGLAVAAWLRTQATPDQVKAIFSGQGTQGNLRTLLVGMALPVCSIGILPVLRELRQLGLPTSKLIVLGLASPLLNPFSLLFGLTVLSSLQYLTMIASVTLLAIVIGNICSRFAIDNPVTAVARPAGLTGGTRIRNLLIASGRLACGPGLLDLLLAIVFSAITIALIRYGAILSLCESHTPTGPAIASLLTLPQYVSPSRAVIQLGGIEDANLSAPTGLAIYLCGTSVGGATLVTFLRNYGWRRMVALSIAFLMMVGSLCYLFHIAVPAAVGEIAETAVLENLDRPAQPFFANFDRSFTESLAFTDTFMRVGAGALLLLILAGASIRFAKIGFLDDDPEVAARQNAARMSKAMSPSQLGAVSIAGITVLLCLSAYVLFQSPGELLDSMERDEVDARIAVRTGNRAAALDLLASWDSAAANIPIGAAIRGSFPTPIQRQRVRDLRMEIRSMKELIHQDDLATAKEKLVGLKALLSETQTAFLGENE